MGTNLSQVFISNTDVLESGSTFGDIAANEVGIWKLDGTPAYVNSKLYELTVASAGAVVNTGDAGAADDPVLSQTTVANPLWLYNNLQFVQKASAGNPLASPIINTRNIRRITYDPFQAFVGHGATIADATLNVTGAA